MYEISINALNIAEVKVVDNGEVLDFDFVSLCFSKKENKLFLYVRNEGEDMLEVKFSQKDKVNIIVDLEHRFLENS